MKPKPDYIPEPLTSEPENYVRESSRLIDVFFKGVDVVGYVLAFLVLVLWLTVGVRWITGAHVHSAKISKEGKETIIYGNAIHFVPIPNAPEEFKSFPIDMHICEKCGAVFIYVRDDMRPDYDVEPMG